LFNADFSLEVMLSNGKSQFVISGAALFLEWCRRPNSGIKSDI
jgi:hypothetical protein